MFFHPFFPTLPLFTLLLPYLSVGDLMFCHSLWRFKCEKQELKAWRGLRELLYSHSNTSEGFRACTSCFLTGRVYFTKTSVKYYTLLLKLAIIHIQGCVKSMIFFVCVMFALIFCLNVQKKKHFLFAKATIFALWANKKKVLIKDWI